MRLAGYSQVDSPNFSSREGFSPEAIVMHYTAGGGASGSVRWLCNTAARASAHFVIGRGGSTWQLVPLDKKAWHAGRSEMAHPSLGEVMYDSNRFTIGIELANHGLLQRGDDRRFYYYIGRSRYLYRRDAQPIRASLLFDTGYRVAGHWEPYPDVQIEAAQELVSDICKSLGRTLPVIGHEDIAMPLGRKTDPGPLFPWAKFARAQGGERTTSKAWA